VVAAANTRESMDADDVDDDEYGGDFNEDGNDDDDEHGDDGNDYGNDDGNLTSRSLSIKLNFGGKQ
jgi:hypothetical protein